MDEPIEEAVRRYFGVVSDLTSTQDDLLPLLDAGLVVVEHPNALVPGGAVRNLTETVDGFLRGKALLSEQEFDVHEVLCTGDRAAVRATWRGVVGVDAGPFSAGQRLTARVAAFLTVRGGAIVRHETFDCYEPFATRGAASAEVGPSGS